MGTVHLLAIKAEEIYLCDSIRAATSLTEIALWLTYPPTGKLRYFSMTATVCVLFVTVLTVFNSS